LIETATAAAPKASPAQSKADKAAQAAAPGASAETAPRPLVQIKPDKLELAEQARNSWMCVVPTGTTAEDLDLRPEAMALIAHLLHRGDDIRAFSADDTMMFDLVCMLSVSGRAVCRVVRAIVVPEAHDDGSAPPLPEGHEIRKAKSGDSQPGWLVWRIAASGNAVENILLNGGHHFETFEQARRFLVDHATMRGNVPQGAFRSFG